MLNKPELDPRQAYYYVAYQNLARSRNSGMAGGLPIPVSEILAYCVLFHITSLNERERLFRYVNSLDEAHLAHMAKKAKEAADKAK